MTQNNEWIEHDGNGCPATVAGKFGWLRTRDCYEVFRDFIQSDRRWIYSNTFTENDNIIAYRLSETDQPEVDDHTQPVNEAVAKVLTNPLGDNAVCAIQWINDYQPTVGTKLYTSPPSAQILVEALELARKLLLSNDVFIADNIASLYGTTMVEIDLALEAYKKGAEK